MRSTGTPASPRRPRSSRSWWSSTWCRKPAPARSTPTARPSSASTPTRPSTACSTARPTPGARRPTWQTFANKQRFLALASRHDPQRVDRSRRAGQQHRGRPGLERHRLELHPQPAGPAPAASSARCRPNLLQHRRGLRERQRRRRGGVGRQRPDRQQQAALRHLRRHDRGRLRPASALPTPAASRSTCTWRPSPARTAWCWWSTT